MNARQRRTLRRAIERVEQELQAASPETTDEECAGAPITAEADCAETIAIEAATSEVACPQAPHNDVTQSGSGIIDDIFA